MSAANEQYETYVRGADANDRSAFDSYLIGFLLEAVDEATRTEALEAAAALVNREGR